MRIIQSGNFRIADAIYPESWTTYDGTGTGSDTQPPSIGTEFAGDMATTDRADCGYNSLFCVFVCYIYAKGNSSEVIIVGMKWKMPGDILVTRHFYE